jgi:hypothetical protein
MLDKKHQAPLYKLKTCNYLDAGRIKMGKRWRRWKTQKNSAKKPRMFKRNDYSIEISIIIISDLFYNNLQIGEILF